MRDNHTSRRAFVSSSRRASKYDSAENLFCFCSSFIKMSLSCLFPLSKTASFFFSDEKQKEKRKEEEEKLVLSRYIRHDWSDDDERNAAEKPDDREERFFVGFDREERRYLFPHTFFRG